VALLYIDCTALAVADMSAAFTLDQVRTYADVDNKAKPRSRGHRNFCESLQCVGLIDVDLTLKSGHFWKESSTEAYRAGHKKKTTLFLPHLKYVAALPCEIA